MRKAFIGFSSERDGVNWLRRKILEEGLIYEDVAKILRVSRQAVQQLCAEYKIDISKRTTRWYAKRLETPELETDSWLKEQLKSGQTGIRPMSRRLGISAYLLSRQIARLGMDPKQFSVFSSKTTFDLFCDNCGKPIKRSACSIKKGQGHIFCSKHCRSVWLGNKFGFKKLQGGENEQEKH